MNLLEQPKLFINVKYFVFFPFFNFRLINLKTNNYLCYIFYCLYDLIQVIVHLFNETAELLPLLTPLLKMSSPTTLLSRVVALPEQRHKLQTFAHCRARQTRQSVSLTTITQDKGLPWAY